jgi:hypothetical protein
MSRPYVCSRCGKTRATDSRRGPLPRHCDTCKLRLAELAEPEAKVSTLPPLPPALAAQITAPAPNPFGRPPAPLPWPGGLGPDGTATELGSTQPAPGPGVLETQLDADLATMTSTNPMAGVLKAAARSIAQAADLVPPEDLKGKLAAIKELRTTLAELTKVAQGGVPDSDDDEPIFGAVRAEVVNPA